MNGSSACRPLRVLPVVLPLLFCVSCTPGGAALYPVHGQVFFAGKPAEGALVTFVPVNSYDNTAPRPSARVLGDASFELRTPPNRTGAAAGEYEVAISLLEGKEKADPNTGEVPNRLPPRYADPKRAGLRATGNPSPNELPPF